MGGSLPCCADDNNHQGGDMGLSLAKTIIEAHGGQLQLSGDPAVGVTVRCLLPVA